jgi:hypothetical protein|tara:strand:- start:2420 stop:3364 length:945 start_codon:yes stop_codon:yes gene_type:complete
MTIKNSYKINYKTLNNFIIFLVISFLFSAIVKLTKVYTKTVTYKINLTEIADDKIITKQSADSISLTVSSFGFDFIKHYLSNQSINIPSGNSIDNSKSFILTNSNTYTNIVDFIKPEFNLISINFDSLFFYYDRLKSKKIPIVLNSNISFSQGYDFFKSYKLSKDSVIVVGPELILNSINSINTYDLELTDLKLSLTQSVKLNLLEVNNLKYSDKTVDVFIDVEKSTEAIFNIPVSIVNIPKDTKINYYPKNIKVSFNVSLENYQIYSSKDFEIICDFNQFHENGKLTPTIIKKPNYIKNLRLMNENVQYVILK